MIAAILRGFPDGVGQAFQPAGWRSFLAPLECHGDWKVTGTGRLESLPYATYWANFRAASPAWVARKLPSPGP
jgi:hypothetical protein